MKKVIFPLIILGIVACNPEEKDPYTSCTDFDKIDTEMLQLIDQINQKHRNNAAFLDAFNMEQVYWIQYRDRRLRSIYPKNWDTFYRKNYGRDVFNPCKCQELLRLAENRMDDMRMYIDGGPADQADCPSMLNE